VKGNPFFSRNFCFEEEKLNGKLKCFVFLPLINIPLLNPFETARQRE